MLGYYHSIEYQGRQLTIITDADPSKKQYDNDNYSFSVISVLYLGREIKNLVKLSELEWKLEDGAGVHL